MGRKDGMRMRMGKILMVGDSASPTQELTQTLNKSLHLSLRMRSIFYYTRTSSDLLGLLGSGSGLDWTSLRLSQELTIVMGTEKEGR